MANIPSWGKFIGATKGNKDMNVCLSDGGYGGSVASSGSPGGKFIGNTKGNRDLPIDRTSGTGGGQGGKYKAGGAN